MPLKARAVTPPGFDLGKPGPHVRVVAPASSAREDRLQAGEAALAARGYTVSFAPHARGKHPPYFSAAPLERLADLHGAFSAAEVDLVMCTRGGYGSNYLLPALDLDSIGRNPKLFFGYSDLTALATVLMDRLDLVVFHGPMLAADFYREDGVDEGSFLAAISGASLHLSASHGLRTLRAGHATGTLYGGCLSILTASLGTPYAALTEGKLLFVEDVGTKPYQIDRMLRQLRLASKFEGVTGIVFGEMLDCVSPGADPLLLDEAILNALDFFSGPIAIGLRSGHVSRANVTLPLNVAAELDLRDPNAPLLATREAAVRI